LNHERKEKVQILEKKKVPPCLCPRGGGGVRGLLRRLDNMKKVPPRLRVRKGERGEKGSGVILNFKQTTSTVFGGGETPEKVWNRTFRAAGKLNKKSLSKGGR